MPDATQVHVYDGAALKGSPAVDGTGNWSATYTFAAGEHEVKAKSEDLAGNQSSFVTKHVKTGVTTVPNTPDLLDDSGSSATDNVTNDDTPQIKVTVDLSSEIPTGASKVSADSVKKIKLYEVGSPNELIASLAPSNPSSNVFTATFQISTPLSDGQHEFIASWEDQNDVESGFSSSIVITIDTTAPNAPVINTITEGQVFVGTSIAVGGTAS